MNKISKNVFFNLAIRMIGFGIVMGIVFPFFTFWMGVDKTNVLSFRFFSACIGAGLIVGLLNYLLVKSTVGKKLSVFTSKMSHVGERILNLDFRRVDEMCSDDACLIQEDSCDEFGLCADAFNIMVKSLMKTFKFQNQHRKYIADLSRNLDIKELSAFALKTIMEYSHSVGGVVIVEKNGILVTTASFGMRETEALTQNHMVMDTLKTLEPKMIEFPENIVMDGVLADFKPSQVLLQPIVFSNNASGVVILAANKQMDMEFLDQIDLFVHDFSMLLNNALQHDQMQKLAAIDPLTGIYNRRFGMERLNEEFSRTLRNGAPLGVIMLDIDHFKMINDTYGHIAGDQFIKNTINVCQPKLRSGDFLIRYGGEEFLAVLPGADKNDTFKIAERLRYAMTQTNIAYAGATISTTISVGVDSTPESTVDRALDLIEHADSALYEAKLSGRNKTILFGRDQVNSRSV